MKLLIKDITYLYSDGWMHYEFHKTGLRGIWNRFVIWFWAPIND